MTKCCRDRTVAKLETSTFGRAKCVRIDILDNGHIIPVLTDSMNTHEWRLNYLKQINTILDWYP